MKTKLHSVVVAIVAVMMPITMWAEIITGTCGENVTYSLDTETGALTISGEGDMNRIPWKEKKDYVRYVYIENGITSICDGAFSSCYNLTSVDIPESVERIGDQAFEGAISLKELKLPDGIKYIGRGAFWECHEVDCVKIPSSAIEIGEDAFEGTCWWWNLPEGLVYHDSWLLGYKGDVGEKPQGDIVVSEGIRGIAGGVFGYCELLTSVSLPQSLKYIGQSAFADCSFSITIPDNVTYISDNAFANCDVRELQLPNSLIYIGDGAFSGCNIRELQLPNSLTHLGGWAFLSCKHLKTVTLSSGLSSISEGAFEWCDSLVRVSIPNTITSIGKSAFTGCKSLTEITIPESVTMIGEKAFLECESLVEFVVPNKVESIEANAFNGCSSLVNVSIPNSVNYIGNYTFYNCDSLKEAFVGCKWEANPQYLYNPLYRFDDSVVVSANLHSYENGKCTECGTTDPTGIDVIRTESNRTSVIYDLQGRRVVNPVKNGIYIVNGELKVLTD